MERGDELRTCERCGERVARDYAVLAFLTPSSSVDLRMLGDGDEAVIEIWCDDCQAERGPLWAMCTGDPAEDCDMIEDMYALRLASRDAIHRAWARLRDGSILDVATH